MTRALMAGAPMVGDWPVWRSLADWQHDAPGAQQTDSTAIDLMAHPGALQGACALCTSHAGFRNVATSSDLREGLQCLACGCNARQRAAADLLLSTLPVHASRARVYATEQASPLFVALRRRIPGLTGSEHAPGLLRRLRLTAWLWRRGVPDSLQDQDLASLTFGDASLDAVISLDVLEHVFDFHAALRELARVLRPGGSLVMTVPFHVDDATTETIARMDEHGIVEHLGTPEFHGDPLGRSVVCFHHFGWDLLDALRAAGFCDAFATRMHSRDAGLPAGQWVMRAQR